MSKWIRSSEVASDRPFLLTREDIYITSLDELGYLLEQGRLLFIEDILCEDFCIWVGEALHEIKKGESLLQILKGQGGTSAFLQCLFRNSAYLTDKQLEDVMIPFSSDQYADEGERHYRIGTQFLKKDRYRMAIYSFREAILSGERDQKEDEWMGKVWHQLGNCYMNEMRFVAGVDCFQRAYLLNGQMQSQQALLLAQQVNENQIEWPKREDLNLDLEHEIMELKKMVIQEIR